jgi:hypothetical protein
MRRSARTVCFWLGLLLGGTLLCACPAEQSSRCRELCQSLVKCADDQEHVIMVIDENECTTTCTALERDPEGKKRVDQYALCADKATDCAARLQCRQASADVTQE